MTTDTKIDSVDLTSHYNMEAATPNIILRGLDIVRCPSGDEGRRRLRGGAAGGRLLRAPHAARPQATRHRGGLGRVGPAGGRGARGGPRRVPLAQVLGLCGIECEREADEPAGQGGARAPPESVDGQRRRRRRREEPQQEAAGPLVDPEGVGARPGPLPWQDRVARQRGRAPQGAGAVTLSYLIVGDETHI
eukprot:scaffold150527_cov33-Prasinocladus_malaysianus.AAC.1